MASLYERIARTDDGSRRLASARLRREVLKVLHRALGASGLSQVELSKRLGVKKSAVNQVLHGDGNLRINTLAEYLYAAGFEASLTLVRAGEPRSAVLRERRARAAAARRGVYSHESPNQGLKAVASTDFRHLAHAASVLRDVHSAPRRAPEPTRDLVAFSLLERVR